MKVFNRILAPIDFSESSRRVLEYALTLGSALDAEVLVLHVVDHRTMRSMPYSYGQVDEGYLSEKSQEEMAEEIRAVMAREIREGVTFEHRVRVTTQVGYGVPYDQIVKAAQEKKIDFIVMGAKGGTALEKIFLGGVAEKVSRHAPCPVFLVRPRQTLG